jgi:hypothetical protein
MEAPDMKDIIEKTKSSPLQDTDKPTGNIIDRIFGTPQETMKAQMSEAENVSMIIKEWLDPKHIRRKTRLTKKQVIAIAILQSLADTYDIKTLKRFLDEFRTGKLSEDGKSSAELEAILKSRMPDVAQTNLEKLTKFLE